MAEAVAAARRHLLESPDEHVRADWHPAWLWLGPAGGGPLVAGTVKRRMMPAHHATTAFLGSKHDVPVAAAGMFVGRRLELQQALRALRGRRHGGVLVHGQGWMGKSSLAARIADRLPEWAVVVVFGDYTRAAVLDALERAAEPIPDARDLIRGRRAEVREHPERFRALVVDLLTGPCAQAQGARKPPLGPVRGPDGGRRAEGLRRRPVRDLRRALHPGPVAGTGRRREPGDERGGISPLLPFPGSRWTTGRRCPVSSSGRAVRPRE
ncbi:ATP-binding protein [Streptomyces laurentii]|uniref:ATP-binding protein n=1 Tax=Streptomyces laurentii TaxID=39478 RepID=UPI0036774652